MMGMGKPINGQLRRAKQSCITFRPMYSTRSLASIFRIEYTTPHSL